MKRIIAPLFWSLTLASLLATASALALAFVSSGTFAAEHHQHPDVRTTAHAEDGKWATDAPLREGMAAIREAVGSASPAGQMSEDQAAALRQEIETSTSFMLNHCSLPAQADAELHGLISELLQGAAALPHAATRAAAMSRIDAALQRYPELFSDPHWQ